MADLTFIFCIVDKYSLPVVLNSSVIKRNTDREIFHQRKMTCAYSLFPDILLRRSCWWTVTLPPLLGPSIIHMPFCARLTCLASSQAFFVRSGQRPVLLPVQLSSPCDFTPVPSTSVWTEHLPGKSSYQLNRMVDLTTGCSIPPSLCVLQGPGWAGL